MSTSTAQIKRDRLRQTEADRRDRPRRQRQRRRSERPSHAGTDRSMEQLFDAALGTTRGKARERRLEEVVLTTWAALASGHPVECPVCGGALTAAKGCNGCGSTLG